MKYLGMYTCGVYLVLDGFRAIISEYAFDTGMDIDTYWGTRAELPYKLRHSMYCMPGLLERSFLGKKPIASRSLFLCSFTIYSSFVPNDTWMLILRAQHPRRIGMNAMRRVLPVSRCTYMYTFVFRERRWTSCKTVGRYSFNRIPLRIESLETPPFAGAYAL